jgi:acyl carrier protein
MTEQEVVALRKRTLDCIAEFIYHVTGTERASVTEDTSLVTVGLDSLHTVELSMELEDELGVELNHTQPTWLTVKEAVDCVVRMKS